MRAQHRVFRRLHFGVGSDAAGDVPIENRIELQDGDKARIAAAALRAILLGNVENDGFQVDFRQGIGGHQVHVVAGILVRMIEVGAVDKRYVPSRAAVSGDGRVCCQDGPANNNGRRNHGYAHTPAISETNRVVSPAGLPAAPSEAASR